MFKELYFSTHQDTKDLERFFLGKVVNPVCFHNLALCKVGCESCDKCYQEYVDCGMASYKRTKTTTTSRTPDVDVRTFSEADSMLDSHADEPQGPERHRVRIPVISDHSSWKGILVQKIREAITNITETISNMSATKTTTATTTTTEAAPEQNSDSPQPVESGSSTGTTIQPEEDSKEEVESHGTHSYDNTKGSTKHKKVYKHHHYHRNVTTGDSKDKPLTVNDTVSEGSHQ